MKKDGRDIGRSVREGGRVGVCFIRRIPVSLSDKKKSTKIAIGYLPEYSVGKRYL